MIATFVTIFLWAAAAMAMASLSHSLAAAWRAHARLLGELERYDARHMGRNASLPRARRITRGRTPHLVASPCGQRAAA